jgi:hypothetical protein
VLREYQERMANVQQRTWNVSVPSEFAPTFKDIVDGLHDTKAQLTMQLVVALLDLWFARNPGKTTGDGSST